MVLANDLIEGGPGRGCVTLTGIIADNLPDPSDPTPWMPAVYNAG